MTRGKELHDEELASLADEIAAIELWKENKVLKLEPWQQKAGCYVIRGDERVLYVGASIRSMLASSVQVATKYWHRLRELSNVLCWYYPVDSDDPLEIPEKVKTMQNELIRTCRPAWNKRQSSTMGRKPLKLREVEDIEEQEEQEYWAEEPVSIVDKLDVVRVKRLEEEEGD